MKIKKIASKMLVVITLCLLISCDSSVKGKWSESAKKQLRTDLEKNGRTSLFIDCFTAKVEKKYASLKDMENDIDGNIEFTNECEKEAGK